MDFSKDRRTIFFRYESKFFEDPGMVQIIATNLGYQLSKEAAQKIFEDLSRSSVEKYITGLPKRQGVLRGRVSGDLLDPQTQWHTHHVGRSGEIGRWQKMLSETQTREVDDRLGGVYNSLGSF
jgi:hypothetical protein